MSEHFYSRVQNFEIEMIRSALLGSKGNRAQAAKMLMMNRSTLTMKMSKYGLREEFPAPDPKDYRKLK